jgi:hypothetical protein
MFNKIRDLFRKPKPFIQEDWSNAKEAMDKMLKLDGKKGFAPGAVVHFDNLFPKLTKTELRVLNICLEFIINYGNVTYTDIANCSPSQTQRQIQSLITKNYLIRVKRGQYKLTFYK